MNRAYVVMGEKQDADWIKNIQQLIYHQKTLEEEIKLWYVWDVPANGMETAPLMIQVYNMDLTNCNFMKVLAYPAEDQFKPKRGLQ